MIEKQIIIVGGGPAGLMASIAAAEIGAKVTLLDKGDQLGRKLAISGGGRCNVTNAKELPELIKHIPGNGRFLYSALSYFGNTEIIDFFTDLGIPLKEEDRGRMFPVSDKAKTVVDTLLRQVRKLGVQIHTNTSVKQLLFDDEKILGVELFNGIRMHASAVIVATGGKSVPRTGSTGDGYPWASDVGHTITQLYPTEVPITLADPFIPDRILQGVALRNIEMTVWSNHGKKIKTHEGDVIFTHFGLSGPAALRCSQYVVHALHQMRTQNPSLTPTTVAITLDLMPDRQSAQIIEHLQTLGKNDPKKSIKNIIKPFFQELLIPERVLEFIMQQIRLSAEITAPQVSNKSWQALAEYCKQWPLHANGTLSIEEAFITGGGVSIKEIDPKTMASKLKQGLYFCGEILDVHGYTGGYNITAAFSTGHCAGRSAATWIFEK
jgi:predicted Rossmann fold flavoprotein